MCYSLVVIKRSNMSQVSKNCIPKKEGAYVWGARSAVAGVAWGLKTTRSSLKLSQKKYDTVIMRKQICLA